MTGTRNIIKFYDAEAQTIERYTSEYFWGRRYHRKRMLVLLSILKDVLPNCETFLDVGCGTGEYLSFSKHYSPQVFGLDLSKRYLQRNKSNEANGLILGDIKALPFRDHEFDCTLCSEVIEHVKEQNTSILEILRITGKFVLVSTPNHGILRIFVSRLARRLLNRVDARFGHLSILKFPYLLRKFRNEEWNIASAFTVHVFPPSLDTIHFPKFAAPLIDKLESYFNLVLPLSGSISIIYLERRSLSVKEVE